jgi:hypothetical protein
MRRTVRLIDAALVVVMLSALSGCGGAATATSVPSPTLAAATSDGPSEPTATSAPEPIVPTLESPDPVEAATEALAARLGLDNDDIAVVDAVLVDWEDTSLGCPRPGQNYLQVMTPGYLVRLAVESDVYEVHTDLVGTAVVCGDMGSSQDATIRDPIVTEFAAQARTDLATELGVDAGQIALVRSEAVEWSSSNLGCENGGDPVAATTTGYRIVLAYGEDRYEYHTDQQRMILCEVPTE